MDECSPDTSTEAELVERCCTGDFSEDLAKLFALRTERWPYAFMHVECGTIGSFDDLLCRISPPVAFRSIRSVVAIALRQSRPELLENSLYLLAGMARTSNTTEMPADLTASWEALRVAASNLSAREAQSWKEICEWYRCRSD